MKTLSRVRLLLLTLSLVPCWAQAEADAQQLARGKKVYASLCVTCHQANGEGVPSVFPPLARSDYLMADKARSIEVVAKGLTGKIEVNQKPYNGVMPPTGLKPEQIADVLTYVRNDFGNTGEPVSVAEVEAAAKSGK